MADDFDAPEADGDLSAPFEALKKGSDKKRARASKGKKRRSEEDVEEVIERPAAASDENGDAESDPVANGEPIEQHDEEEAPSDVKPMKGKQRSAGGVDIRYASSEKQAEYLSKQLTSKDGVAPSIAPEDIIVISISDRSQEGIWKALSSEITELQALGGGEKAKHKSKKAKKQGDQENAAGDEAGAPKFVLLTSSSTDGDILFKALSTSLTSAPIARAFQRRQKIESQIAFLKHPIAAIVGLPPRLHKLADIGSLSFTECSVLAIDMTRNAKNFNFFDVKDIRESFAALYHTYLAPLVAAHKLRIVLY